MGNDGLKNKKDLHKSISIHVPAWGTTQILVDSREQATISIHVPAWGTTDHWQGNCRRRIYFNPRSRVGNDVLHCDINAAATRFQSTFPRGERRRSVRLYKCLGNFNPRSRVGNDVMYYFISFSIFYFNPRSRVGNDCKFSQIFFDFLCNKYNFSTFYYPFSLFFDVIHFTFLIFVVRILPVFYVYF